MSAPLTIEEIFRRTALAAHNEAARLRSVGQEAEAQRYSAVVNLLAGFEPSRPDVSPEDRLLRIDEICGDPRKGIPRMVPVDRESWRLGVLNGRYPQPIRIGQRFTVWKLSDIEKLLDQISQEVA